MIAVSDLTFADIDGGAGTDTLRLDGSGLTLDLTTLDNTSLDGIERIDLNAGGNALVLDRIELQRLSDTSNTLRVLGDATDSVDLSNGAFFPVGTVTDSEGTFDIYTDGNARLEVRQSISVTGALLSPVELSDIEMNSDARGFVINGVSASDRAGGSVSGAGDVNGDGFDDLIVGAIFDDPDGKSNAGASFVVFGKTDGTAIELSALEQSGDTTGFVINGVTTLDFSGRSVSNAGDVNGDGFDDLIVGAYARDPDGKTSAGASYVVFGKMDGTAIELSDLEQSGNTTGFVIKGVSGGDISGFSVSGAGDVNGDGLDDLIVGARDDDPNGISNAGASFVVFGKTDGAAIELSTLEQGVDRTGFVINGASAFDNSGSSVSGAGDVNGDGFDDLIVGAFRDNPNGVDSGASFVVFGRDFTDAATKIGSTSNDALSGTAGNDNIFAGTGDDTITSSAGTDRVSGGNGADVFDFLDVTGETSVIDFVSSEGDQLDVSAFSFANFAALQATFSPDGPGDHDSRIALDGNTDVVLIGVESGDLVAGDFIL